jgi:hypothetical protein
MYHLSEVAILKDTAIVLWHNRRDLCILKTKRRLSDRVVV